MHKLLLTCQRRGKINCFLFRGEVTVHSELIVSYLYQQPLLTSQEFFSPKKQGTLSFHFSSFVNNTSRPECSEPFFAPPTSCSSSIPVCLSLWIYKHNSIMIMLIDIVFPRSCVFSATEKIEVQGFWFFLPTSLRFLLWRGMSFIFEIAIPGNNRPECSLMAIDMLEVWIIGTIQYTVFCKYSTMSLTI